MHFWSGALAQARWIRQHIKETPTIDAVEVVHGRWVTDDLGRTFCSECKSRLPFIEEYDTDEDVGGTYEVEISESNYCPNCGAKMDGGATE